MALMADQNDQQTNFKHFCRVCKKGFMCGRALGGHMRAHGIGDESGNADEEDQTSDWEERGNSSPNKRMYKLRTNANRLKSCKVCANCGKEFLSWKSFLEHGKCSSDSPESSPESENEERRECQWSKRKRSLRGKVGSSNSLYTYSDEEDYAATCLVMLSNARVDPRVADQPEESCASASKEEERRKPMSAFFAPVTLRPAADQKGKGVAKGMFECKACKKVFNSHQALGGHRASHKKVKGCFATRLQHIHDGPTGESEVITQEQFLLPTKSTSSFQLGPSSHDPVAGNSKRKSKVHECSICHRIFSSGQALGGHKRCHWITSNSPDQNFHKLNKFEPLDLSLVPARSDDLAGIRRDPRNLLSFEVSTEINLHSWVDVDTEGENNNYKTLDDKNDDRHDVNSVENVEDEADSKVKLAKLSELKDMKMSGDSSGWLQVGIGSSTGVGAVDP
ncbi:zinc finger protein ZAT4-like [Rhododendron vialii]|uniref:zinc finger protein ZAT4-like n=1 Tax=Rhododendron vialii TaxID=182163 RepID=UPI00265D8884|nr:zinc finger protein ZAT4-like [Rhododendron vialii]